MRAKSVAVLTLTVTAAYAVVRYNVFKGVAWSHLPLFVMDKAVAWTTTVLLLLAARDGWRRRVAATESEFFACARVTAAIHVLASLVLLSDASHPDLFDGAGRLNLWGESSMLLGVLAAVALLSVRTWERAPIWLALFAAGHAAIIGVRNWITPETWPGHMPPITFLGAIAAVAALWFLRREPRRE